MILSTIVVWFSTEFLQVIEVIFFYAHEKETLFPTSHRYYIQWNLRKVNTIAVRKMEMNAPKTDSRVIPFLVKVSVFL